MNYLTQTVGRTNRRNRLLLVLTAIFVPVVLLAVTEAALRIGRVGFNTDVTVPCTVHGRAARCDNLFFNSSFFPPGMIRLPRPYAIPDEKAPGTFRIFVLGESAAFGDPEPSYSFSRYLEVMLRSRFPNIKFEIVNTGVTAINSHVVLPIAKDLAKRQPDVFIIYLGNNEVVGPFGAGTVLTSSTLRLPAIRATIALKSTRLGQVLSKAVTAHTMGPQQWGGMEMFLDRQVRSDSPEMTLVYRNFRSNLDDTISAARSSGARVLVSTVATNLKDCAPFASTHRRNLSQAELVRWTALVEEAMKAEGDGSYGEALKLYEKAADIDSEYADLHFRIARCLWELGEYTAAKPHFVLAQRLDTLRFRADTRLNDLIRSAATAHGPQVDLVDAQALLSTASPQGVPGSDLFYDHVHFKPRGNYLLARALFRNIATVVVGRKGDPNKEVGEPSEDECDRLLALTAFDRVRVANEMLRRLQKAPFVDQSNHREHLLDIAREAETPGGTFEETDIQYRWAIEQFPDDHLLHLNHGYFLYSRFPAAATQEFLKARPYDRVPLLRYGR